MPQANVLTKIVTANPHLDRVQDHLLSVINPVLKLGTSLIQGFAVPRPATANDGQVLQWNQTTQAFQYADQPVVPLPIPATPILPSSTTAAWWDDFDGKQLPSWGPGSGDAGGAIGVITGANGLFAVVPNNTNTDKYGVDFGSFPPFKWGKGTYEWSGSISIAQGTDPMLAFFGLTASVATIDGLTGATVGFVCDTTVDATKWAIWLNNGAGVVSHAISNSPVVDTAFHTFTMSGTAAAPVFQIDGVTMTVTTASANFPTALMAPCMYTVNQNGANTSNELVADYFKFSGSR